MPIRERVGRYVNTGKNCWNLEDDQNTVIALLNRIPAVEGGTEGLLGTAIKVPIIRGIAHHELYMAIQRFQRKQFGTVTGFIDTVGRDLLRLEYLVAHAPPPSPIPDPLTDHVKSGDVDKALHKALIDDVLSHAEIVDIVYSTLSNGIVSQTELNDLETIANLSKTITPRSKKLLITFKTQAESAFPGSRGPYRLTTPRHLYAAERICGFLKSTSATYFPLLNRDTVGLGLLMRIANPGIIDQGKASLCGPASFLFNLATDDPVSYAVFGIELYEKGRGILRRLDIKPGSDVRNYLPPINDIDQVDWLTLASIRDSENWFLDYDSTGKAFAGMTMPSEMFQWFRKAGYTDVQENTSLVGGSRGSRIDDANKLLAEGYRIIMLIDGDMTQAADQGNSSAMPNHWVVLRSPIERSNGKVTATIFTWGRGNYKIPQGGEITEANFLKFFYGFVAAKM